MDDDKPEDEVWTDLLAGLASAWSGGEQEGERPKKDDGERYLAAARAVSRGNLS